MHVPSLTHLFQNVKLKKQEDGEEKQTKYCALAMEYAF